MEHREGVAVKLRLAAASFWGWLEILAENEELVFLGCLSLESADIAIFTFRCFRFCSYD